ncbi:hypothetical protein [Neptunitalea lumnitzerae]|uniref:Membrane protein n=1 Tax=Neptunitalea lumnitzerae TaxID=2965509 RepID=A0ABQ5MK86_9FLAO|nr:hypothetical protein [Neptunitalea sp. Y10]GLB49828.1 membrane protein [Neptunitalea sp. Y10]
MLKQLLAISCICFATVASFAQEEKQDDKYTSHNKGKIFFYWGGNGSNYTKSDIHFRGNGYNFTVHDAIAHDKPRGWSIDYINPSRMTIPQTNFEVGYFISDHYNVSFKVDHMKYVMTQYQQATVSGLINLPESEAGSEFNGIYNNDEVYMTEDFLMFEHTDGLNYIHLGLSRFDDVTSLLGPINTDVFQINVTEGIGGGILLPKTNATLLSKERHDDFHVSGYGVSADVGVNLTFFKHFFVRGSLKGGFIDMPNIRTTNDTSDKAKQHFFFYERLIGFGVIFKI